MDLSSSELVPRVKMFPCILFDLTPYIEQGPNGPFVRADIDFQDYAPTDAASYSIASQVVAFKAPLRHYDLVVMDIIAPSQAERNTRWNPTCGSPIIEVKTMALKPYLSKSRIWS